MTVWGVAVLLLGATLAWADGEAASTVSAGAADPAELRAVVVDDQLSEADRRQAAAALLAHEGEPARGLVLQLLAEPTAARLWRPLVIAMGQASTEPAPELVEPLVALLGAVEPAVQADLAAALGRYEDTQLVERLSAIAASERHELAARHGAALALGHQRSQAAAAVLIELIADDQPEAVRTPAFAALAVLTGREELGHDRAAWQAWWTSASELNEKQWHAHLLANFAEQTRLAREQHSRVEGRLVDAHRTLYRNAAGDEREARLIRLLEDPMPALRRLGLEMAVQRLVNDRAFEEPVREALRNRLDDPESAIRQRATLLLRDLADAPAADRVAHRLAEKREQSEPVLRANLLLMSRLPRIEAVERSLELLSHPTLRGEAAGALAASVDADRLTYQQGARALRELKSGLDAGEPPLPQIVVLLGRLGGDGDWERIERWLDSGEDAVKQAAARAWADSDRRLGPLIARLDDRRIELIALAAAGRRGSASASLRQIARHEPASDQAAELWQRALEEMAGRVPPETVLAVVRDLEERSASTSICRRMLAAAIDRTADASPAGSSAERAALLLARGRLRLAAGEAEAAVADFDRIAQLEVELTGAQEHQIGRSVVEACLAMDDLNRAFERARIMLALAATESAAEGDDADEAAEAEDDEPVEQEAAMVFSEAHSPIDLFLDAADHAVVDRDAERVEQLVAGLRTLVGPTPNPTLAQRLSLLEAQVEQWREDASDDADTGAADSTSRATNADADESVQ